jgi:hypothetical protein
MAGQSMAGHRQGHPLPGNQHRPYRRRPRGDPHQQDQEGTRTPPTQKSNVGPPHSSKILPLNGPIFLVLELRFGEMLPQTLVQVCPGPSKKGESTEAFADGVTDVISKGVLHFINLPVGEGGDGSPKNKLKGGGVGAPVDT